MSKTRKRKSELDKYIGDTILITLPTSKRPQWRWIVSKRNDGRYIVRVPKRLVKIRELSLHRSSDYGKKILLPEESKVFGNPHKKSKRTIRK